MANERNIVVKVSPVFHSLGEEGRVQWVAGFFLVLDPEDKLFSAQT